MGGAAGGSLSSSELNSFLAKTAKGKIDLEANLHKLDQYAPSPKGFLYFPAWESELFKYFP